MIKITFTDNQLTIEGHAADSSQSRTVESIRACEAVTATSQTLIASILELTDDKPEYRIVSGSKPYIYLDITHLSDVSRTLVDAFKVGVAMFTTTYPRYITVIEK